MICSELSIFDQINLITWNPTKMNYARFVVWNLSQARLLNLNVNIAFAKSASRSTSVSLRLIAGWLPVNCNVFMRVATKTLMITYWCQFSQERKDLSLKQSENATNSPPTLRASSSVASASWKTPENLWLKRQKFCQGWVRSPWLRWRPLTGCSSQTLGLSWVVSMHNSFIKSFIKSFISRG